MAMASSLIANYQKTWPNVSFRPCIRKDCSILSTGNVLSYDIRKDVVEQDLQSASEIVLEMRKLRFATIQVVT